MKVKDIATKAALQLNLPPNLVWGVYKLYWFFIRQHISILSFSKLRPNINIPSLGKFHVEWERLKNKKEDERLKNKKA